MIPSTKSHSAIDDAGASRSNHKHSSGWWNGATWLALLAGTLLSLCIWAAGNRPVRPPDFTGRPAGLAFSPFQRGQGPETGIYPDEAQLRADLQVAAGISGQIRTYTVQGVLGEIPRLAEGLKLRITLGAWLSGDANANAAELHRLAAIARAYPNVDRVMVGNETLLRHDLTPIELIAAIAQVKRELHIPVSTAEPWHVWLANPALAQAVDVITIHLLPYWEGLPEADAERFVMEKLDAVRAAYPGKKVVIGEIGWPSNGVEIGAARASQVNQALFLRRFFVDAQNRGLDYFVMEAFDQPWKTSFEGRAAGYWGLLDLDRRAKWPMFGPVAETPEWQTWAGGSTLAACVLALVLLSRRPDIRFHGKLLLVLLVQGFCATLACVLLAMSGKYLSGFASVVWGGLAAGQTLLLVLLLADSFDLAETLWGRVWRRRITPVARVTADRAPKVSIHVPICNEPPQMVRRTLDGLAALDYSDFEVLVVDNNTLDAAIWQPVAEHCARLGARFRFFHLGPHPGFKAGALNFALRQTSAVVEIIGVLDADYVVSPDWLAAMVPSFDDPMVGFAQSPQDYRDASESAFKRLMFWEYAGFFQLGMVNRNERNAIIQHGTMSLIRRVALEDAGGWGEWTITEDAELGLRLLRAGWRSVYAPTSFGRGVMPDDFAAFRRQRFRWAYGAMQISRRHWRAMFSPFCHDLTLGQRWHFVTGWLPWVGDALGLAFMLVGLVWSVGLVVAPMRVEFPIVLFMLPSIGLFGFKLAQILALYRSRVDCGLADRLGAALAGLALSHTIGKAVWKGLVIRSAPFLRTPKMADAPALVSGLWMAREEALLLALNWAAMAGVAIAHRLATVEARLWCLVLLTQSLPYLASVVTSVMASLPSGALRSAVRPAGQVVASGGSSD